MQSENVPRNSNLPCLFLFSFTIDLVPNIPGFGKSKFVLDVDRLRRHDEPFKVGPCSPFYLKYFKIIPVHPSHALFGKSAPFPEKKMHLNLRSFTDSHI